MAHALGLKDEKRARQVSSLAFWGGLIAAVVFSRAVLCPSPPPSSAFAGRRTRTYAWPSAMPSGWSFGAARGTILNLLLGNLVRAEGGAAVAAFGVALGGVCNIILDPIFVLPQFLDMGAEGAGAATAISNLLAALFFIAYILAKRGRTVVSLSPACLRGAGRHLKNVLSIGFPSCVQYALTVVAAAALSKFVSGYETEAVAALGIVKKTRPVAPVLFHWRGQRPFAAAGLQLLLGRSGAAARGFVFGCGVSLGFALLCLVVYEIFAPALTGLFIADARTIEYSAAFLRTMVVAMR